MRQDMQIHPTAVVGNATLGADVRIGEYAVIRDGVSIGAGSVIHPHVVIESGAVIGANVEIFAGSLIGKEPKGAGATARTAGNVARRIVIGDGCSIGPRATLFYDVELGSQCLIGDGASIREGARIGDRCLLSRYVTLNYNVTIGAGTKVMDLTHLTGNCVVGRDVFISTHVSTTNDNALGKQGYEDGKILGPRFGDNCVVGANSVFLPGVEVGAGAVVASGAVVTKSVAEGSRVFGIPARTRGD
jgi:acetyltransferase-like isoleucine patch superfamily enzyme